MPGIMISPGSRGDNLVLHSLSLIKEQALIVCLRE